MKDGEMLFVSGISKKDLEKAVGNMPNGGTVQIDRLIEQDFVEGDALSNMRFHLLQDTETGELTLGFFEGQALKFRDPCEALMLAEMLIRHIQKWLSRSA